jgi:[ribosomal protein S18]-alanine N-acetyltransferase
VIDSTLPPLFALRDYRPGDWEAMHALDLLCFEPPFCFSRRSMRGFAEAPRAIPILAEADGELAGFCIVQIEEHAGYIVTLDVAQNRRRHGLARRLMAEAETRIRAVGGTAITLHVFPGNAGAVRFYEAIGYHCLGTVEGFYGRGLDALAYGKWLQAW